MIVPKFELTEQQCIELNNWLEFLKGKYGKCGVISYTFIKDGIGTIVQLKSAFGDTILLKLSLKKQKCLVKF